MRYSELLQHLKTLDPSVRSVEQFLRKFFTDEYIGDPVWDIVCRDLAVYGDLTYQDTYWEDMQGILAGIVPSGPATPPTENVDGEGWEFSNAVDNIAVITVQTTHKGVEGATLYPHIHWRKTTDAAGTVMWQLDEKHASVGADFGAYALVLASDTPAAGSIDNNTAARHLITALGTIDMTGTELSTILHCKLTRDISEDTYAAPALALSFDIHYPIDAPGSREQFVK